MLRLAGLKRVVYDRTSNTLTGDMKRPVTVSFVIILYAESLTLR
jgi:hypothetical protein